MEDINKPILDQVIRKGFPQLNELHYKFTAYSLNSEFSFKFDSLIHFVTFLKQKNEVTEEQIALLETALKDVNLAPTSYFFINFFTEEKNALS